MIFAEVADLILQTAEIQRANETTSDSGATTRDFIPVAFDVPCRLYKGRGRAEQLDPGLRQLAEFTALFDPATDIKARDRLIVAGLPYNVMFIYPVYDDAELDHLQVGLERAATEPFLG